MKMNREADKHANGHGPRTLGPVPDLERHLPSDWWRTLFNSVYLKNLCDEGYHNDPFKELHVPAALEILGVPYTGAGPSCLGLCYNKGLVRSVAESLEVPVPMESYLGPDNVVATIPATFPALVKPNFGDSSVGITMEAVVKDRDELLSYIEQLRAEMGDCPVVIQEFLEGPEYSVGVIGNPGLTYTVLPLLEVDYSGLSPGLPRILGYESKWLPRVCPGR